MFVPVILLITVGWNLLGNLVVPGDYYVPFNLGSAFLVVWLARRSGMSWSELGLTSSTLRSGLVIGFGAALLVGIGLGVAVYVPALESAFENDGVVDDSSFERWFVPAVRIPLGTAVSEELLFRSVVLGWLLTRTTALRAVVISSFVFGLWHLVPAWEGASGSAVATAGGILGIVAVTTVAGGVFGWLRCYSGNVMAPILAHIATNSFAYVAALVVLGLL